MNKTGRLHFFSETGTEGGYYAFQDMESIDYVKSEWAIFKGRTVYDPDDPMRSGKVVESYTSAGSEIKTSKIGDISFMTVEWQEGEQEQFRRSDSVLVEKWSHGGLTLLLPMDGLTVYQKGVGSAVLWAGNVEMERQDPYHPESYTAFGLTSHYRPMLSDIDPDSWSQFFIEEKYATLERK